MAPTKPWEKAHNHLALNHNLTSTPKPLLFSYLFDWLIIILFAASGAALSVVKPAHRPFSLLNLEISNPYVHESIPIWILGIVAFAIPILLIALITLLLIPGPTVRRQLSRNQVWRIKLWELEKGLAGLCLSVAVAFFITQGMKNLFGRPRPNLLARCQPDFEHVAEHVVSGWGQDLSARWTLVDSGVCLQTDQSVLNDGFRSFPSGHSSWSWSGLLYLSFFFASKFGIGIPQLPSFGQRQQQERPTTRQAPQETSEGETELLPLHTHRAPFSSEQDQDPKPTYRTTILRSTSAAPPLYLLIPFLTPIGTAIYICSTRYVEFYHFGFDILSGSLIGILSAWGAFRWYHAPVSRGEGWAWGARSVERSWWRGVGEGNWGEV